MGPLLALLFLVATGLLLWLTVDGVRASRLVAQAEAQARPLHLRVTERADFGRFVRLALARPAKGRLPAFTAGDHLMVLCRPDGAAGRVYRRAYSLAAWHARPDHYELLVKREDDGKVSGWLYDSLRQGDTLEVLPPRGAFHLTRQGGERLLVAAGVGITPMRAMLQRHASSLRTSPVSLFWSLRHEAELGAYHQEFLAMASRHDWFRYYPSVTRPSPVWQGATTRLSVAELLLGRDPARVAGVWICASATMTRDLAEGLTRAGLAENRVHFELFGIESGAQPGADPARVMLEPEGVAVDYLGEPSLLMALEDKMPGLEGDCRAGHCGACRLRLVSGKVVEVLPPQVALRPGEVLACCCRPDGDLAVALP